MEMRLVAGTRKEAFVRDQRYTLMSTNSVTGASGPTCNRIHHPKVELAEQRKQPFLLSPGNKPPQCPVDSRLFCFLAADLQCLIQQFWVYC